MGAQATRPGGTSAPKARAAKAARPQLPPSQVFISHMALEEGLAQTLAQWVEKSFPANRISVFVSSAIHPGDNWVVDLEAALTLSKLFLVLCSKVSICSPWVLYEVGTGFGKRMKILPVCHGGLAPGKLPQPLGFFTSLSLSDPKFPEKLTQRVSAVTGVRGSRRADYAAMRAALAAAAHDVAVKVATLKAIGNEPQFVNRSALQLASKVRTTEVDINQHLQFLEDKDYVRSGNIIVRHARGYSLNPKGEHLLSCLKL